MSSDRIIGSGDGMPWDVPAEYEQYLQQVSGEAIVMGRKSFEIFGADLSDTGTQVFVLSRTQSEFRGAVGLASLGQAAAMARGMQRTLFVGGGASVYEAAIPIANRMHLSTIEGNYTGDTHFPQFDPADWLIEIDEPRDGYRYREYSKSDTSA